VLRRSFRQLEIEDKVNLLRALSILLLASLLAIPAAATGGARDVPATPASPLLAGTNLVDPCATSTLDMPLKLLDAVSRSLCANSKTRGAWVAIKLYAAQVRSAKEGYLPTLSATGKETESKTETRLNDEPELNTDARDDYPAWRVDLTWVLYDFGQRGNQLDSARDLLAAARANLDVALQQVFLRAAANYYDAQAAQASLEAATQIENLTQKSLDAAHARMDRGVAPVSDELQARTAHAQAVVTRVKARADLDSKRGAVAIDMGLDPDIALVFPAADLKHAVRRDFTDSLHQLIAAAKKAHPSVAQAESQLAAAKADERFARARGYPSISLVGDIGRTNQPLTPSLGSPTVPGSVSDRAIGIEITLPISDPLWKRGTIAQAHAHVEIQQEALEAAEEQVAANVWDAYTILQADTDNLDNSQALLDSAQTAFEAAQRRYDGGAGNILELLSSQTAFANAQQQRIQSLSDWRIARLTLAASLGRLGMSSVEDTP
jgi:outer membrane protein